MSVAIFEIRTVEGKPDLVNIKLIPSNDPDDISYDIKITTLANQTAFK